MIRRYVCVHGHFYQPPQENPWLESIERQESAHPYHDWNERVTAECYAPNAASRIFDDRQRIVEIARATVSGASVLMLDEPFAGLSSVEQERLSAEVDRLRSRGIALLLVEHNLEHVRSLADTVLAMDEGAEFVRGTATEVLDSAAVRERYLGEEMV